MTRAKRRANGPKERSSFLKFTNLRSRESLTRRITTAVAFVHCEHAVSDVEGHSFLAFASCPQRKGGCSP